MPPYYQLTKKLAGMKLPVILTLGLLCGPLTISATMSDLPDNIANSALCLYTCQYARSLDNGLKGFISLVATFPNAWVAKNEKNGTNCSTVKADLTIYTSDAKVQTLDSSTIWNFLEQNEGSCQSWSPGQGCVLSVDFDPFTVLKGCRNYSDWNSLDMDHLYNFVGIKSPSQTVSTITRRATPPSRTTTLYTNPENQTFSASSLTSIMPPSSSRTTIQLHVTTRGFTWMSSLASKSVAATEGSTESTQSTKTSSEPIPTDLHFTSKSSSTDNLALGIGLGLGLALLIVTVILVIVICVHKFRTQPLKQTTPVPIPSKNSRYTSIYNDALKPKESFSGGYSSIRSDAYYGLSTANRRTIYAPSVVFADAEVDKIAKSIPPKEDPPSAIERLSQDSTDAVDGNTVAPLYASVNKELKEDNEETRDSLANPNDDIVTIDNELYSDSNCYKIVSETNAPIN